MEINKVGVIGVGVMGSNLALLFAGKGVDVSIYDRSTESLQRATEKAKDAGLAAKVHACDDYESLCQRLGSPKVFIFSLPHGRPGDGVVQSLLPYLTAGDVVIDGSNENYLVTQKRQALLQLRGVSFVGMGISGGFSGARDGPSLMPGGDEQALDQLLPLLRKIAATDDHGRPCVTKIGSGGSGHYVKMVHNGIEHGMMSVLCEAWELMDQCLGMDGEHIGSVFDSWSSDGELRHNYLVAISASICRQKCENSNGYLLHHIRDAVVQDANDSEGTGLWANVESVQRHVPAPSLSAAHCMRIASADVLLRDSVKASLGALTPVHMDMRADEKTVFLEHLRRAVYVAVLACFIQGFDLLGRVNAQEGWAIDFQEVTRIWRAGCIIQSDYITDLFEHHYAQPGRHPLCGEEITRDVRRCWPSLKQVVLKGVELDAHVPCLSATLEYLKYSGSTDLPTNFTEAQMDCFGAHGFDLKFDPVESLSKGKSTSILHAARA